MILTGPAIRSAVKKGEISIDPFTESNLNPNSYNYHLGDSFLLQSAGVKQVQKVILSNRGYVLYPGRIYLGSTFERIGSERYITLLLGRSSIGRLGIFLNVTADLGHLGSLSHWTLEINVVQPVKIYPRMQIGQISFWTTDHSSNHRYSGRYHGDKRPVVNRDHRITNM